MAAERVHVRTSFFVRVLIWIQDGIDPLDNVNIHNSLRSMT